MIQLHPGMILVDSSKQSYVVSVDTNNHFIAVNTQTGSICDINKDLSLGNEEIVEKILGKPNNCLTDGKILWSRSKPENQSNNFFDKEKAEKLKKELFELKDQFRSYNDFSIKPGMVVVWEGKFYIVFNTAKGLGISGPKGWFLLNTNNPLKEGLEEVYDLVQGDSLDSGKLLWSKDMNLTLKNQIDACNIELLHTVGLI